MVQHAAEVVDGPTAGLRRAMSVRATFIAMAVAPYRWPRACTQDTGMRSDRRCALWVTPEILAKAIELAEPTGLDVDDFITFAISSLYDHEERDGQLRARAAASATSRRVIPMAARRNRWARDGSGSAR